MGAPVYSYATQFLVYLEGLRVTFNKYTVVAGVGSPSYAQVEFTFTPAVINLRARTVCELFFRDAAGELRRLFIGELSGKGYSRSTEAPTFVVMFKGTSANFNRTTMAIANQSNIQFGEASGGFLPGDHLPFVGGDTGSLGPQTSGASAGSDANFLKNANAPALSNIIIDSFADAFNISGAVGETAAGRTSFDYQKAIASAFKKYIDPDFGKAGNNFTPIIGGSSTFFSIANARFGLIDGIDGFTSTELAEAYFTNDPAQAQFFLFGISNAFQGRFTVLQVIKMIVESSFHIITDYDVAPPVLTTEGIVKIPSLLFFPDLKYADPPTCNIFLPRMLINYNFSLTTEKVTRLIAGQVMQSDNGGRLLSLLPVGLSKAAFAPAEGTAGAASASYRKNNYISQEEIEIGLSPAFSENLFPALADRTTPEIVSKWLSISNPIRWIDSRAGTQGGSVTMSFNPYVAIGMPCAVVDGEIVTETEGNFEVKKIKPGTGIGVVRGQVFQIQHSASPTSGVTAVQMGNVYFQDDEIEMTPEGLFLDGGFLGGFTPSAGIDKLNIYDPAGEGGQSPNDVYKQLLGVKSASGAADDVNVNPAILELAAKADSVEAALLLNARALPDLQTLIGFYESPSRELPDDSGFLGPLKLPYETPYISSDAKVGAVGSSQTIDNLVATDDNPSTPESPKLQDRRAAVKQLIIELESF